MTPPEALIPALVDELERHRDWEPAFSAFFAARKPDADAIGAPDLLLDAPSPVARLLVRSMLECRASNPHGRKLMHAISRRLALCW